MELMQTHILVTNQRRLGQFQFSGEKQQTAGEKTKMGVTNFASKVSTLCTADLLQAGDREPNSRTVMETCHCTSSVSRVDEQCPTRFFFSKFRFNHF